MGHTPGMKATVSIPDRIFRHADRLARRLRRTRSAVYAAALEEYLARHDPDAVTAAMNRVCHESDTAASDFVVAASRRVLEGAER